MVTSHKNDKSKYLSYHQRNAIHTVVSAHPQAKPTEVKRNLKNFSPSKHVSASQHKSVGYAVLQERDALAGSKEGATATKDARYATKYLDTTGTLGISIPNFDS